MSQLIKSENVLSQPNALQVHENELFNTVAASIAKCYADLNQAMPSDPTYLVTEVTNSILNRFPAMRLPEIPIAFANGIRGDYGQYFGLSVISFEQFIEGYLTSESRRKLVQERNKVNDLKSEPTKDEKFDTAKNLTLEVFEKVKLGKQVGLNGATVYEFLNSISLIGPDYKKGVMPRALEEYVQELKAEAVNCMEIIKRRYLNQRLELLQQNIEADAITPDQYKECKRVAKRLILTDWMRDHMLEETDLNALIESRRNAI